MIVYVLEGTIEYECFSSSVLGVYTSQEEAVAAIQEFKIIEAQDEYPLALYDRYFVYPCTLGAPAENLIKIEIL